MPYSIPLERAFLAKEFSRGRPSPLRVVGTLLDSAFESPRSDREIERLCTAIDEREARCCNDGSVDWRLRLM